MANRKPSERELRFRLRVKYLDVAGAGLQLLIPWGALVIIAWLVSGAISALAGQHTFADIGLRMLADVKISEGVAYLFGVGGVGYGLKEKVLRRRTIERLSGRIQELERKLDPGRSSSKLTSRGTTRPEDKV